MIVAEAGLVARLADAKIEDRNSLAGLQPSVGAAVAQLGPVN